MNAKKLFIQLIGLGLIILVLGACASTQSAIPPDPPTSTIPPVPPTEIPLPPTNTPIPPTTTPVPPTTTPEPVPTNTGAPEPTPVALSRPAGRGYHSMVYDAESKAIILFGGEPNPERLFTDTWAYRVDTNTWQAVGQNQPVPNGGNAGSVAYDAESDRVIVYINHYFDETYSIDELDFLGETWAYDFNSDTWTNMETPDVPFGFLGARLAYDAESDRVILFGGWRPDDNEPYFDQTWAYDFNANRWEQMHPEVSPSPRNFQAMAYDPEADRVILFGGEHNIFLNDTWAYDYNTDTWELLEVQDAPSIRAYCSMAYVDSLRQTVLFGGISPVVKRDTWAFDYDRMAWTEYETEDAPTRRAWYAMTYDPVFDTVVLHGGGKSQYFFDDQLWYFNPATLAWVDMTAAK